MKYYAVIVAGGSGNRMKAEVPKQFMPLLGRPILMHTIEAFFHSALRPEIILVLNPAHFQTWNELCNQHNFQLPVRLVPGGQERFHSVRNALADIEVGSIVAVHDAVRPVVSAELIERCFREAESKGAVIPTVESRDSLRQRTTEGHSRAIRRDEIVIVQTPQVFRADVLKKAYTEDYSTHFTDDASVVEHAGYIISLTQGDYKNIKITFPEDLQVASLFLGGLK
ncbi:2-C-methyl-D-erythritol 4-phosphate cytidylyltransferase [Arcticibacter sp. MXS-1]|uniref:2-C-methyl-D-erythritol 4-phosphate cytidylyltransferase n=1 Tax=Arcticibacter sp. MXS-1 TaxID=3341726 RepID=UPI0035A8837C